jgi:hypothetical protein
MSDNKYTLALGCAWLYGVIFGVILGVWTMTR